MALDTPEVNLSSSFNLSETSLEDELSNVLKEQETEKKTREMNHAELCSRRWCKSQESKNRHGKIKQAR